MADKRKSALAREAKREGESMKREQRDMLRAPKPSKVPASRGKKRPC